MPKSSIPTLAAAAATTTTLITTTESATHFSKLCHFPHFLMANDAVLRVSLVWLAAVIVVVGICTESLKKMMLTYVVGLLGIAGLLLPDWGYFDRDFSRWTSPVSADERASEIAQRSGFIARFRKNPMRLAAYATVYGYALYKWWMFVSSL